MDCNMPDFPVIHYLLELAQPHVHCVSDAIQPSHPLSSPTTSSFACPWRWSQNPLWSKGTCHLLLFFFFLLLDLSCIRSRGEPIIAWCPVFQPHYAQGSCILEPSEEKASPTIFLSTILDVWVKDYPLLSFGVFFFFSFLQYIFGGYFFHSLSLFFLSFFLTI